MYEYTSRGFKIRDGLCRGTAQFQNFYAVLDQKIALYLFILPDNISLIPRNYIQYLHVITVVASLYKNNKIIRPVAFKRTKTLATLDLL